MSDSLSPWLCEYIISIAETYGAQLANIPATNTKKKKVQIKEAGTPLALDSRSLIFSLYSF